MTSDSRSRGSRRGRRFALLLAKREVKGAARRVGVYMLSTAVGVAAIVSIQSVRDDVSRAITDGVRETTGYDARVTLRGDAADRMTPVLDSLRTAGARVAAVEVAGFGGMARGKTGGTPRIAMTNRFSPGYPFFGNVQTDPPGLWTGEIQPGEAFVDRSLMAQLGIAPGDTIMLGAEEYQVVAGVSRIPGGVAVLSMLMPNVYTRLDETAPADGAPAARSRAPEYRIAFSDPAEAPRFKEAYQEEEVRITVTEEVIAEVQPVVENLGELLAMVGLVALLLGGIGVASSVHLYVKEKRRSIAVLRCLGSGQWTAFWAYMVQALALGAGGAVVGIALGFGVQTLLGAALEGWLPVDISPRPSGRAMMAGAGMGIWVAAAFAAFPLLQVRGVSALEALRRDSGVKSSRAKGDVWAWVIRLLAGLSIPAVWLVAAPVWQVGALFGGVLLGTLGALSLSGWAVTALARRLTPRKGWFALRQGLSNLFRPGNQTLSVTITMGAGAFVLGLVVTMEAGVKRVFELGGGADLADVLVANLEPGQLDSIKALFPDNTERDIAFVQLGSVGARVAEVGGRPAEELAADSGAGVTEEAVLRTYRISMNDDRPPGVAIVDGAWWESGDSPAPSVEPVRPDGPDEAIELDEASESDEPPADIVTIMSLDATIAGELGAEVGDTIIWRARERRIVAEVVSLQEIEDPPGEIGGIGNLAAGSGAVAGNFRPAPGLAELGGGEESALIDIPDYETSMIVQRQIASVFPNVIIIDFSWAMDLFRRGMAAARAAVTFLAAFTALVGAIVLVATLAGSRRAREAEAALLRTLGAAKGQVAAVLVTEFAALGTLAAAAGLALSAVAAGPLLAFGALRFDDPEWGTLAVVWAALTGLSVLVGMTGNREVLRKPPLPFLRRG